jgi:hypothetical protein
MSLLVFLPIAGSLAAAAPALAGPHAGRSASGPVVVNELLYDPPEGGSESAREWVEILNTSDAPLTLSGWRIADNRSSDLLPDISLPPGGYAVIAGGAGFLADHPGFDGLLVDLGGAIGNGLGNGGDQLRLIDAEGRTVDALSYGDDASQLDPALPDVEAGHSLERMPAGRDRDLADDWIDQPAPSPGGPAVEIRVTDPPTAAPPPTVPPGAVVVLNEYLPAPNAIDWDGDGQANQDDEWVELFNPGDSDLELRGWQIDDEAGAGSPPYVIPDGTQIAARGHLLIFKRDSGLALNNGGDAVRLLQPDGTEVDAHRYSRSAADKSYARLADGELPWTDVLPPSPGAVNGDGRAPTSAAGSASPTAPPNPSPTAGASAEPSPVPSPAGPSATPDPSRILLPILISEVLFDPALAGNDAAAEWLEVHNRSPQPQNLLGWSIGDRGAWDALPAAVIPPQGFAIIAASASALEGMSPEPSAPILILPDGKIGGGLGNTGDLLRLRGPTGAIVDALSYGANLDAFDPSVPLGPAGSSIERIPPDRDSDSAEDWWVQPAPSPGRAGPQPSGPPSIRINEVLPAPRRTDWDHSGDASFEDEWIELYNPESRAVDLSDWQLEDRPADGWSYALPAGSTIPARGFLLVFRRESGIALTNEADTLRLIRPEGIQADRFDWSRSPGYDRSWSRRIDGAGLGSDSDSPDWTADYAVTPGGPNRPRPEDDDDDAAETSSSDTASALDPTAPSTPLSDVRDLPAGSLVQVRGRIIAPPDLLAARSAYIGDEQAGLLLYLSHKNAAFPALILGDRVLAFGRLKDFHGERELVIARPEDILREGPGRPPAAIALATGALNDLAEGRLIRLTGRVTGFGGPSFTLDDGSGPARVLVREATGLRRPWLKKGQQMSVIGIAGQYARAAPWQGGHRLMPRFASDLAGRVANAGLATPIARRGVRGTSKHLAGSAKHDFSRGPAFSPGTRACVLRPMAL